MGRAFDGKGVYDVRSDGGAGCYSQERVEEEVALSGFDGRFLLRREGEGRRIWVGFCLDEIVGVDE